MPAVIVAIFIITYLFIAVEHGIRVNKAATALVGGVLCWTLYMLSASDKDAVLHELTLQLGDLSQILFFLLGAMTIVELIDAHNGFEIITNQIKTKNKRKLLWIIALFSFILSAVLDNLTTTIVMVSLLKKLITDKKQRLLYVGLIVIAANAGGAWSPIGDVTTTMLWIGGRVSASNIVLQLILPSLVCLVVPVLAMQFMVNGETPARRQQSNDQEPLPPKSYQRIVFFIGITALLFVPVFKALTNLPPFMAMMVALGAVWIIVELLYRKKEEARRYSVSNVIRRIDTPSILFFLGILLAVSALQSTGQLKALAVVLDNKLENPNLIVMAIGLLSAIVDNVPLVAATMGMYGLNQYPQDHFFWEFLAYCTGTGGSVLIIGSAAGVAAMGIEKISFGWYLKKISLLALAGYFAGAFVFLAIETFFR